jgi:hypothetical protein
MPPPSKRLCRIAPAAAMVDKFVENTQNNNKKLFLASYYGTNQSLVVYENFIPPKELSTQLSDATSCIKLARSQLEQKSLWTFLVIKRCQRTKIKKVIKQS